jgi:hypothetical protein
MRNLRKLLGKLKCKWEKQTKKQKRSEKGRRRECKTIVVVVVVTLIAVADRLNIVIMNDRDCRI